MLHHTLVHQYRKILAEPQLSIHEKIARTTSSPQLRPHMSSPRLKIVIETVVQMFMQWLVYGKNFVVMLKFWENYQHIMDVGPEAVTVFMLLLTKFL